MIGTASLLRISIIYIVGYLIKFKVTELYIETDFASLEIALSIVYKQSFL